MDWKDKLGGLKEVLPEGENMPEVEQVTSVVKKQSEPLRVEMDKRNGKPATIISNFFGGDEELKELGKTLKVKCGAGGSARDGEILVQGDFRVKIAEMLLTMGYKVKKINFK
ncbi:translation initiation factor [Paludibacter sp.]|uniref:translation initiation factor n=1 Tax=Paludibacter sp. TaxID=1898105 RepID=UPI0013549920|nr:translation initiation factor [Paludibacter sp.]MTK52204.1 translation initiation factor [Paludibacter sp.]